MSGTLSLSPKTTQAAVDTVLTASLSDPDGGVTGIVWQWQRWSLTAPKPGWQAVDPGTDSTTYTPVHGDIGSRLRVRASYGDTLGSGRSAEDASIERVVHVPAAPGSLAAAAGDTTVTLSWDGAVSHGAAITQYEYRRRPDEQNAASWTAWAKVPVRSGAKAGDARAVAVSGLTNDTLYTFSVRAVNGVGPGVTADTPATPRARTLVVQGPGQVTVGEGHTDTVATYRVSDGVGRAVTPVTWDSLGGPDRRRLKLSAAGGLSFTAKKGPDYEAPGDANRDSVYEVLVQARQAKLRTAPKSVRVRIGNRDDPGFLTFAPNAPRVGQTMGATLADTDGGAQIDKDKDKDKEEEEQGWQWDPPSAPQTEGASASVSLLGATYTVPVAAVGRRVRVTVTYDDAHGPGKSARDSTGVVRANVPGAPDSLRASAGDRQVTLSWSAADSNGAAIDRYQWRRRPGSAAWTRVAGGDSARTAAVTGLVNDSLYTFYLRARNRVGFGAADSVSATPRAPVNRAPTVTGPDSASVPEGGKGPWVVGSYSGSDPDAGDVLRWRLIGADSSRFRLTGPDSSRSLALRSEPDYESRKRYAVEVEVRDRATGGRRDTAAVTVTVSNVNEPGTVSLSGTLSLSPKTTQAAVDTVPDGEPERPGRRGDGDRVAVAAGWSLTAPKPGWQAVDPGTDSTTYTPRARRHRLPAAGAGVLPRRPRAGASRRRNADDRAGGARAGGAGEPGGGPPADTTVTLTWDGAVSNGSAITHYQYRRRPDDEGRGGVDGLGPGTRPGTGIRTRARVAGVGSDQRHPVHLLGAGGSTAWGRGSRPIRRPRRGRGRWSFRGRGRSRWAEGHTDTVATYRVSDGAGRAVTPVTWDSLGGPDSAAAEAVGRRGACRFTAKKGPDYEAPGDAKPRQRCTRCWCRRGRRSCARRPSRFGCGSATGTIRAF